MSQYSFILATPEGNDRFCHGRNTSSQTGCFTCPFFNTIHRILVLTSHCHVIIGSSNLFRYFLCPLAFLNSAYIVYVYSTTHFLGNSKALDLFESKEWAAKRSVFLSCPCIHGRVYWFLSLGLWIIVISSDFCAVRWSNLWITWRNNFARTDFTGEDELLSDIRYSNRSCCVQCTTS